MFSIARLKKLNLKLVCSSKLIYFQSLKIQYFCLNKTFKQIFKNVMMDKVRKIHHRGKISPQQPILLCHIAYDT